MGKEIKEGGNNEKRRVEFQSPIIAFSGDRHFGIINLLATKRSIYYACILWSKSFFQSFFSFCGNIYGKGHWYSQKECILDGLIFIALGIIGEIEIILYLKSR